MESADEEGVLMGDSTGGGDEDSESLVLQPASEPYDSTHKKDDDARFSIEDQFLDEVDPADIILSRICAPKTSSNSDRTDISTDTDEEPIHTNEELTEFDAHNAQKASVIDYQDFPYSTIPSVDIRP